MDLLAPARNGRSGTLNFNWKQGLFNDRLPRRFQPVQAIWELLRGVILWTLWIEPNDLVFNGSKWHQHKALHTIWLGLVDYGRLAWGILKTKPIEAFCESWGKNEVLASVVDGQPNWKLSGPVARFLLSV